MIHLSFSSKTLLLKVSSPATQRGNKSVGKTGDFSSPAAYYKDERGVHCWFCSGWLFCLVDII